MIDQMIKPSSKTTLVKRSEVEIAILRTLSYAEVFHKPMHKTRLYERLLISKKISKQLFDQSVDRLVSAEVIYCSLDYFALKKQRLLTQIQIDKLEKENAQRSKNAVNAGKIFRVVPTVREVYLTGSSATETPDEFDDLDFFVVTHPNSVWITRLLLVLITTLIGRYAPPVRNFSTSNHDKTGLHLESKHDSTSSANSTSTGWSGVYKSNRTHAFCLNMWASEDALAVPVAKQSIFTAHEILFARPLLDSTSSLFHENGWARQYFGNLPARKEAKNKNQGNQGYQGYQGESVFRKSARLILSSLDHFRMRFNCCI